jgi:hypothetical protein
VRRGQIHHVLKLALDRDEPRAQRRRRVTPFLALELRKSERETSRWP